jgi:Fe2+ or Zn2+ uptake regulation protein
VARTLTPQPRLPKNYALLRDVVDSTPALHRTAHEVFLEARRRQPTIGYATVHRGLTRLCELGVILKVEVPGGDAAWYEPAAPPHAHLICEGCRRVVDVHYHTPSRLLTGLAAREGLELDSEVVVFRGRCHDCVVAKPRSAKG